ncbi:ABC transporter permease subunit [Bacillus salacetis]|uniref:ABC transporter permease subunit n=1 Tax=Bacillus salacetis TaxID=2315464 RepID=UPI003BA205E2
MEKQYNRLNFKVASGVVVIGVLSILSFFPSILSLFFEKEGPSFLYSTDGKLIGAPPFSPSQFPPLGTDQFGESLLYQLVEGTKFTLFFVIIVACLRIMLSLTLSILYAFWAKGILKWMNKSLDIIYFIPPVFIVFFIMGPVQNNYDQLGTLLIIQIALFTLIAIPPISVQLGEEMASYLKEDFVKIVQLSGAGNFYIFKRHIFRLIKPRIFIVFLQQIIQILILLIHLSILGIFVGGAEKIKTSMTGGSFESVSISNEWAGLIGLHYKELFLNPWLTIAPLVAFTILIFAVKLILSGISEKGTYKEPPLNINPATKSAKGSSKDFTLVRQK